MPAQPLFPGESPVAQRQPKTDRLILERYARQAANDKRLDEDALRAAHAVLLKWADLESSGRLARLNETQMQGDFLAEVFGQALAYAGPLDGQEVWHREQHRQIAGETPDAVLGFFRQSPDCPWSRRTTLEAWISERVLKLTCTAEDMLPLADAANFTTGSFQKEYGGRLNKWDEAERAELMADLDAAYLHLYGIDRDDAEYILSTFKGIHDDSSLFPGHVSTAQRILQKYAELSFPA